MSVSELPVDLLRALPKTDLHCHLDGSLRLDTVLDLAKRQNMKLPTFDRGDLQKMLVAGEHITSLDDYLRAFDITLSVMQTEEGLERSAYELAVDAWAENVRYIEVRYSPLLHIRDGLRPSDFAVRYGGEELLAVLPETSVEQAHMVADRLCQHRGIRRRTNLTGRHHAVRNNQGSSSIGS